MRCARLATASLVILLGVGFLPQPAFAQGERTNASITGGNVNCRTHPPRFGASTFFRFKLIPGEVIGVLHSGTRVEALERTVVAGKYEWFRVRWHRAGSPLTGWIYAGSVGNRQYLRLDPGVDISMSWTVPGSPPSLVSVAHAQPAQPIPVVEEPSADTEPIRTLAIAGGYVVIFVAALAAVRKWVFPQSKWLTFLTSFAILLILGFITMDVFQKLLTDLATAKG